jgi:hypothetical protein
MLGNYAFIQGRCVRAFDPGIVVQKRVSFEGKEEMHSVRFFL